MNRSTKNATTGLAILCLVVFGIFLLFHKNTAVIQAIPQTSTPNNLYVRSSIKQPSDINTEQLWSSVNSFRASHDIAPLLRSAKLDGSAKAKCDDMITKNYWAHDAPDGTKPWKFIIDQGIHYTKAGENLAYGLRSSDDTLAAWISSPPHRENLLDSAFTNVGYAVCYGANFNNNGPELLVVQHFSN